MHFASGGPLPRTRRTETAHGETSRTRSPWTEHLILVPSMCHTIRMHYKQLFFFYTAEENTWTSEKNDT